MKRKRERIIDRIAAAKKQDRDQKLVYLDRMVESMPELYRKLPNGHIDKTPETRALTEGLHGDQLSEKMAEIVLAQRSTCKDHGLPIRRDFPELGWEKCICGNPW